MLNLSNELLVQEILEVKKRADKLGKSFDQDIKRIEHKYSPRSKFERWRDSDTGKMWKDGQHKLQQKCCAECHVPIPLKGSHIDHIKPICKYPELSLTLNNLRVTCAGCNLIKGAKVTLSHH